MVPSASTSCFCSCLLLLLANDLFYHDQTSYTYYSGMERFVFFFLAHVWQQRQYDKVVVL
jgi:hypothetical protein